MRIKRFIAPDMRTALRMVRDEQGPDAVILSNRTTADGIEVVAATDYDEALVAQALRAAAPGLETIVAPIASASMATRDHGTFASIAAHLAAAANAPVHAPLHVPTHVGAAATATAVAERVAAPASLPASITPAALPAPARDSFAARARAVFRIGDGPTLAELSSVASASAAGIPSPPMAPVADLDDAAIAIAAPAPTRLEAMMAAMGANPAPTPIAATVNAALAAIAVPAATAGPIAAPTSFAAAIAAATFEPDDWASIDDDYHVALGSVAMPVAPLDEIALAVTGIEIQANNAPAPTPAITPALHAVGTARPDPSMLAMREELTSMRQLIERQMEQLSLERLRGSPA
ncbi:MAG: hypothetical protein ACYC42_09840, partial [Lysobacter sp.]